MLIKLNIFVKAPQMAHCNTAGPSGSFFICSKQLTSGCYLSKPALAQSAECFDVHVGAHTVNNITADPHWD